MRHFQVGDKSWHSLPLASSLSGNCNIRGADFSHQPGSWKEENKMVMGKASLIGSSQERHIFSRTVNVTVGPEADQNQIDKNPIKSLREL